MYMYVHVGSVYISIVSNGPVDLLPLLPWYTHILSYVIIFIYMYIYTLAPGWQIPSSLLVNEYMHIHTYKY